MKPNKQTEKLLYNSKIAISIALSIACFILYYSNIWSSYGFGEAGGFQLKGIMGYFNFGELESISHPSYIIFASFFYQLFESVSFASILSASTSAITIFVFCLLGFQLTGQKTTVFVFAIMLALTHAFFWLATIPEVYSLHIMLLSIEAVLFFKFWQQEKIGYLYVITLLSGFNLGVHQLEAFNSLAIAISTLLYSRNKKRMISHSLLLVIVFLIGFFPTLFLLYKETTQEMLSFDYLLEKLFIGRWVDDMFTIKQGISNTPRLMSFALLSISFITPAVWFSIMSTYRVFTVRNNPFHFYLALSFVLQLFFVLTYAAADAFTFSLPVLFFMYLLAILYFKDKKPLNRQKLFLATFLLQPIAYSAIPYVANTLNLQQKDRVIPYRNSYEYYSHPFKKTQSKGATKFINDSIVIFKQESGAQDLSDIYILGDWTINTLLGVAKLLNDELSQVEIIPSSRHATPNEIRKACSVSGIPYVFSYFIDKKRFLKDSFSQHQQDQILLYKFNCNLLKY